MILVVFGHVLLMMGFPTHSIIIGSILISFRMPLFFFVSGFFAYRALEKWSIKLASSIVKRKICAQVICTLIFYSLYQICHSKSPLILFDEGFSWFWFTIVLFQMFLVYLTLALTEKILKYSNVVTPALIGLSAITFLLYVKCPNIESRIWNVLSWYYLMEYFQFFAFGILCRKYYQIFVAALESNSFRTAVIAIYVASLCLLYSFDGVFATWNKSVYNIFEMLIVRYAGLCTVFVLFYNSKDYFAGKNKPSRWLRFVGRRTLDIYMLHVFLLPNLLFLKPILSESGMTLNILTIGIVGAILDIAVCLFISNILRSSRTLSEILFGEKSQSDLKNAVILP